MDVQVNYLAVFLAGLASMAVGAVWYAQSVFGRTWAKLAKVDMSKKVSSSEMAVLMGGTFVISLITAYVMAHVTFLSNSFYTGNSWMSSALQTAGWAWLGFTAVRFTTHDMFEGRPRQLTLLNIGNELATFLAMGLVIGLLKP